MAPFEMPVAKTRRGLMQSVRFVVRSIACTKATSGFTFADGNGATTDAGGRPAHSA